MTNSVCEDKIFYTCERSEWRKWLSENYEKFPESYKRIRISYINAARKRPKEFEKRLNNFLTSTRKNKMIKGYGGTEKYYFEENALALGGAAKPFRRNEAKAEPRT